MTKYRAKPTVVDGIRFASQKEAARYSELKLLEKAGEICDLELQPRYELLVPLPKDHPLAGKCVTCVGAYVADFRYTDRREGVLVEDVKGMKTPVYRLKKKMVEATYGIKILET